MPSKIEDKYTDETTEQGQGNPPFSPINQKMSKSDLSGINIEDILVLRVRKELGNIVKDLIKENGWTQAQAAEFLGINQPRISDIVNGRVNRHSVDKLIEILDIFDYKIDITVSKKTKKVIVELKS